MYREQAYVERCHCNVPAIAGCVACGRARCAMHLEKGLCNRCAQAIGRELDQRSGRRWVTAGAIGTTVALGTLIMHVATASIVGLPIGIAAFFVMRVWQRATLVERMGPALSASKGELPPAPQETPFNENPPPFIY